MKVIKVEMNSPYWEQLIDYAQHCSWEAGQHLASMIRQQQFHDWESVFAAIDQDKIIGFCTFLKTDYYPENRYSPWISSIFVDENNRGHRVSQTMINEVIDYAQKIGFTKVYIPSDIQGLYEKYGFHYIDELKNYSGVMDHIFMKEI